MFPSQCGSIMRRVPELIDVWFDSGSMGGPVGLPFKNQEMFEQQFPADYICEVWTRRAAGSPVSTPSPRCCSSVNQELHQPGAHSGRPGPQDVQKPGQYRRAERAG